MTLRSTKNQGAIQGTVLLEDIRFQLDISRITDRLRFTVIGELTMSRIREILQKVQMAAKPRGLYQTSRVTAKTSEFIEIDGVRFNFPLLRTNLDKATLIFPFCVTAGSQIEAVACDIYQPAEIYCVAVIKQLFLDETIKFVQNHLRHLYHLPYIWSLIAGEMEAWPLSGQKMLFEVLGEDTRAIGVKIQPDFSLVPSYSRSGIFYFSETEFEGCQVCSKEPCMMRRAQFNAELAAQKGLKIRKVCGKDTA
jgi:hypothetical protein